MTMPPLARRPGGQPALLRGAARARGARTGSGSCRWGRARTTSSRCRRARRSCGSAQASIASASRARHNLRQGNRSDSPNHHTRYGLPRHLASHARLLRPRRGRGVRRRGDRALPGAGGRAPGQLPRAPQRPPAELAAPPRRDRRHLRRRSAAPSAARRLRCGRSAAAAGNGRNGGDVRVHFVAPKNFNDVQDVADKFKDSIPVILNLQGTDTDLVQAADRLLQRAHLRARRRHAADRRQGLPADAAQRRGLRRGARAAGREGLLQPARLAAGAAPSGPRGL